MLNIYNKNRSPIIGFLAICIWLLTNCPANGFTTEELLQNGNLTDYSSRKHGKIDAEVCTNCTKSLIKEVQETATLSPFSKRVARNLGYNTAQFRAPIFSAFQNKGKCTTNDGDEGVCMESSRCRSYGNNLDNTCRYRDNNGQLHYGICCPESTYSDNSQPEIVKLTHLFQIPPNFHRAKKGFAKTEGKLKEDQDSESEIISIDWNEKDEDLYLVNHKNEENLHVEEEEEEEEGEKEDKKHEEQKDMMTSSQINRGESNEHYEEASLESNNFVQYPLYLNPFEGYEEVPNWAAAVLPTPPPFIFDWNPFIPATTRNTSLAVNKPTTPSLPVGIFPPHYFVYPQYPGYPTYPLYPIPLRPVVAAVTTTTSTSAPTTTTTATSTTTTTSTTTNYRPTSTTTTPILPQQCGITRTVQSDQERIVGGSSASPYEFPWMVVLFKGGRQFCGGSLITRSHILTAAHCVARMTSWDVAAIVAHLGDYNIRTELEVPHVIRRIKRVVRHRSFDFNTLHNDIAILTINEPVKFSYQIQPICLPVSHTQLMRSYSGQVGVVAGWGSLRENGAQPAILQKVQVPIWRNSECARKYGRAAPGGITASMICAGQATRDSCSGDSGGPLLVKENGRYVQVGIVSWGIGCGKGQYPGVYTRVTSLLPWIFRNLGSN